MIQNTLIYNSILPVNKVRGLFHSIKINWLIISLHSTASTFTWLAARFINLPEETYRYWCWSRPIKHRSGLNLWQVDSGMFQSRVVGKMHLYITCMLPTITKTQQLNYVLESCKLCITQGVYLLFLPHSLYACLSVCLSGSLTHTSVLWIKWIFISARIKTIAQNTFFRIMYIYSNCKWCISIQCFWWFVGDL